LLAASANPWQTLHLKVSTKGLKLKGTGQNIKHIMQVVHLVCAGWLEVRHFKRTWGGPGGHYALNTGDEDFVPWILKALASQAMSNQFVFAASYGSDVESVESMRAVLLGARASAWAIFDGGVNAGVVNLNTPNQHARAHHIQAHLDYVLACISNTRFETCHGRNRMAMAHCNHQHPEVTMMEFVNVTAALECVAANGGAGPELQAILSRSTNIHTYAGDAEGLVFHTVAKRDLGEVIVRFDSIEQYFSPSLESFQPIVDTNAKSVTGFVLKDRELYARDIDVGSFHTASIGGVDVVVHVNECLVVEVRGENHFFLRCTQLLSTEQQLLDYYPVLKMHSQVIFPAAYILRPAHVVHNCTAGCVRKASFLRNVDQVIIPNSSIIYGLNDLNVAHDYCNTTFLLNPFYLK
jgi:hypothetical protein